MGAEGMGGAMVTGALDMTAGFETDAEVVVVVVGAALLVML
jgi:hypothetical protein